MDYLVGVISILFTPQKPRADAFDGYLEAQGGSHLYGELEGALNVPVVEDKLAVRVAAKRRVREGYSKFYPYNGGPPVTGDFQVAIEM